MPTIPKLAGLRAGYERWHKTYSSRQEELRDLEARLENVTEEAHCRHIASDLIPVAAFYGRLGICDAIAHKPSCWDWLARSARASYIAFRIKCISYDRALDKEIAENWAPNILRVGLSSLLSLSVLSWEEAKWLSGRLEQGRHDGSVSAWDLWNFPSSRLPIALRRYLDGHENDALVDLNLGVYEGVFDAWTSISNLKGSLGRVIDYHMSQVGSANTRTPMEFGRPPFDLFPAEIVAIKRVRDRLGLETPKIDHLLVSPFFNNLPMVPPSTKDELMDEVLTKVRTIMPEV